MSFRDWIDLLIRRPKPRPPAPKPTPIPTPTPDNGDWISTLLELHNKFRADHGKPPLRINARLNSSAQMWATWMASRGQMAHEAAGYTVQGRIETAGYKPWANLAENIAEGYPTPNAVMIGWENSPGHRANILGPCLEVGLGKTTDGNGTVWWCADFGNLSAPGMDEVDEMDMTIGRMPQLSGPLSAPRI